MKTTFALLLLLPVAMNAAGQDADKPSSVPGKFHLGINYSYLHTNCKVYDMSFHSVWKGEDFGTIDLDDDAISELNSSTTFEKNYSGIGLQAGWTLPAKSGSHWRIDGNVMIGLTQTQYKTSSKKADSLSMQAKSGMNNPAAGLMFRFDYLFNKHWGVSLVPYVLYAWGKPSHIDDNMNPGVEFFNETREFSFSYLYTRLCPMGFYQFGNLQVSAGPGFYYLYMTTAYKFKRTDPATGFQYEDDINTAAGSKSFIDGNVAVRWRFIKPLILNAFVAVGGDFVGHAGIAYVF